MLFRFDRALFAFASLVALAGCGGSSSKGQTTAPAQTAAQVATAIVQVNVATGQVTISPPRTLYTGPSVTIKSSVLVNVAGSPGQKAMSVTLSNNSTEPIGVDPNGNANGVAVLFGAFTVTGGSSADPVVLSNATGIVPNPTTGGSLPYITYPGSLAAAKTSAAQNWNFTVPSGVTAFSVPVTVEADSVFLAEPPSASGHGSSSAYVRTFAGSLSVTFQNGYAGQARFANVNQIDFDQAGDIFVADSGSNCIRRISPSGLVSTVAGNPSSSGSGDGPGNVALFYNPDSLAVTADGSTIYVADSYNNTVRRISFQGGDPTNPGNWTVSTICGIAGTAGGNYSSRETGDLATLNYPAGLAMDTAGNVFIAEYSGQRVRELTFSGGNPGVAHNWTCALVAGDTSAPNGVSGTTDGQGPSARLHGPFDIAVDNIGHLYVCEYDNCRVRKIDYDGNVTTLAGGVSGDTSSYGYADGPGATARFSFPRGIAVDPSGLVYVADSLNYRVRAISQTGNVTTVAGNGTATATDGTGDIATFKNPSSVGVSSSGSVYVGDSSMVRIVEKINPQ